jgi:hypothetical protein
MLILNLMNVIHNLNFCRQKLVLFCSSITGFFNNKMTNWKSYVNSHIMFPSMYDFFFFLCDLCSGYHVLQC